MQLSAQNLNESSSDLVLLTSEEYIQVLSRNHNKNNDNNSK